jgi:WD40 repeat protein/DNA-binding SARP family transcriptional activator
MRGMRLAVLGSLEVEVEGEGLLGPRDRVVLSALASQPGVVVTGEQLASALWGDDPPASWNKVVQGCVVRLRKALGQTAITTQSRGYQLTMAPDDIDSCRFEKALARAGEYLALGEPERASREVGAALELWRGPPFVEIVDWEPGRLAARRLEDLRLHAEELRLDATLRSGRVEDVLASALAHVEAAPDRPRRWELLAIAQHWAGRQDDAERTERDAHGLLASEGGADVLDGPFTDDVEATADAHEGSASADLVSDDHVAANRRGRLRWLVVALVVVVTAAACVLVFNRLQRVDEQARVADARRVSSEALAANPLDRALLLSAEAVRMSDSPETRGNLLTTIGRSLPLASIIRADGSLLDLELAPSGDRAVVVDSLGAATQYDLASRQAVVTMSADGFSYTAAAFAAGGSDLAMSWMADSCRYAACDEFGVSVLDADDPQVRRSDYAGLNAPPVDVAFSSDGRLIAAVPAFSRENPVDNISVWQVDQPDEPLVQLSLDDTGIDLRATPAMLPPGRVIFSPDGKQLYASGAGGTVEFDLATREPIRAFDGLGALALSPDGDTIAIRNSTSSVVLRMTSNGDATAALDGGGALVTSAAFSSDGTRVATATADGTVRVWDVASGARLRDLTGHEGAVLDVVFGADDTTVLGSTADGSILTWALGSVAGLTSTLAYPSQNSSNTNAVLVSPTAGSVAVIADRVYLSDLESRQLIELGVGVDEVASAAYSMDGSRLATVGWDGTTKLWDTATGALLVSRPGRGYANFGAIAFTADGAGIVVADADERVVELDGGTLEPTGRSMSVGFAAATVRTSVGGLVAVTWSPPDPAGGTDVVFGDIATGQVIRRVHLPFWSPRSAFSGDGSRFAVGGFDGRLGIIDVATGRFAGSSMPAHRGPITGVAFSPDGSTLMSIGSEGDLVLSEGVSGQARAELRPGETDRQGAIGFRPDGHTAIIGYGDGSVIAFETNAEAWMAHACDVAGRNLTNDEWRAAFGDDERHPTCPEFD